MNKSKFLLRLKRALRGCSPSEIQSRLAFYSEMIDDRVEEGLSEKEAVQAVGNPDDIASEIRMELNERPKKEKRPLGTGAKILIAVGSPIWLSLLIAAAAVGLSVFVCLFAVFVSFCAVWISLGVSGIACVMGAIVCFFTERIPEAFFVSGGGLIYLALAIWLFCLCAPIGKWTLTAIRKSWNWIIRLVLKRREYA